MEVRWESFVWDSEKEAENIAKHNVDFKTAIKVFKDTGVRLYLDEKHSESEQRLFALGKVGEGILTVRFIYRDGDIRIFGAGYWRKGKKYYEKKRSA